VPSTIDLDSDFRMVADEVDDVPVDRNLMAEVKSLSL
jgi:hypothetical protein